MQGQMTTGTPATSADPAYRYVEALRSIANVLGDGTCRVPNCPGCHYEMEEAASIARDVLAGLVP
jgi:hypothetical protein